jgi:hypothetical protein
VTGWSLVPAWPTELAECMAHNPCPHAMPTTLRPNTPVSLCHCCPAGSKSQDDAAEDPLTAVKEGLTPNYQLYWCVYTASADHPVLTLPAVAHAVCTKSCAHQHTEALWGTQHL